MRSPQAAPSAGLPATIRPSDLRRAVVRRWFLNSRRSRAGSAIRRHGEVTDRNGRAGWSARVEGTMGGKPAGDDRGKRRAPAAVGCSPSAAALDLPASLQGIHHHRCRIGELDAVADRLIRPHGPGIGGARDREDRDRRQLGRRQIAVQRGEQGARVLELVCAGRPMSS